MSKDKHILPGGKAAAWQDMRLESGGLAIAEMISSGVSIGVFALLEDIAPNALHDAGKVISKAYIEPNLDFIERKLQQYCHLKECQPDRNKSREERAEMLAETLVKFSASLAANLTVKFVARKAWNTHFGLEKKAPPSKDFWEWLRHKMPTKHDLMVLAADEGVHLGSLFLVNNSVAKYTDIGIEAMSKTIQSATGWSKKRSDEVASMAIVWELPNLLGLAAGSGVIANDTFRKHGVTWKEAMTAHHPVGVPSPSL